MAGRLLPPIVVHITFLLFYIFGYYYYKFVFVATMFEKFVEEARKKGINLPPPNQFGGDSKFLTIWCLMTWRRRLSNFLIHVFWLAFYVCAPPYLMAGIDPDKLQNRLMARKNDTIMDDMDKNMDGQNITGFQAFNDPNEFGGGTKFLTLWNLLFQTFFFFWCCITDLVLTSGSRTPIARKFVAFRDWFLAAVAFPIGTLVVSMFWAIWAVDRELVFPKELDEFFPPWLNHVLHTTVLPILLVEMFLVQHKVPSRKAGVMGTLFVGLSYLLWVLYLGYAMDIWVYPVLQVLSGISFGIFITVAALFLLGLYIVGEKINEMCWRGYPDSDYEFTKVD